VKFDPPSLLLPLLALHKNSPFGYLFKPVVFSKSIAFHEMLDFSTGVEGIAGHFGPQSLSNSFLPLL
jgi:hypothetical protein